MKKEHIIFFIMIAVFIIGVILCNVLPGWYKLYSSPCLIIYIVYQIRLLNNETRRIEKDIISKVKQRS